MRMGYRREGRFVIRNFEPGSNRFPPAMWGFTPVRMKRRSGYFFCREAVTMFQMFSAPPGAVLGMVKPECEIKNRTSLHTVGNDPHLRCEPSGDHQPRHRPLGHFPAPRRNGRRFGTPQKAFLDSSLGDLSPRGRPLRPAQLTPESRDLIDQCPPPTPSIATDSARGRSLARSFPT